MKERVFVEIVKEFDVEVDESKFTPEFMQGFRDDFYQFHAVEEHVEHLAQLYARGIVNEFSNFIEGYGNVADFGIKFTNEPKEIVQVGLGERP